jgi:hypothetical protein
MHRLSRGRRHRRDDGAGLEWNHNTSVQEFLKKQILDPKANNPASLIPNLGFSDADAKAIWASLETLNGLDDA